MQSISFQLEFVHQIKYFSRDKIQKFHQCVIHCETYFNITSILFVQLNRNSIVIKKILLSQFSKFFFIRIFLISNEANSFQFYLLTFTVCTAFRKQSRNDSNFIIWIIFFRQILVILFFFFKYVIALIKKTKK